MKTDVRAQLTALMAPHVSGPTIADAMGGYEGYILTFAGLNLFLILLVWLDHRRRSAWRPRT